MCQPAENQYEKIPDARGKEQEDSLLAWVELQSM